MKSDLRKSMRALVESGDVPDTAMLKEMRRLAGITPTDPLHYLEGSFNVYIPKRQLQELGTGTKAAIAGLGTAALMHVAGAGGAASAVGGAAAGAATAVADKSGHLQGVIHHDAETATSAAGEGGATKVQRGAVVAKLAKYGKAEPRQAASPESGGSVARYVNKVGAGMSASVQRAATAAAGAAGKRRPVPA